MATLSCVVALTNEQKWEILKRFKAEEQEMIFESDAVYIDARDTDILDAYKKLNIYETIGKKVNSKREYLELQNEKLASRVTSLENAVNELDEEIQELVNHVNLVNKQIVDTKKQIDTTQKTIQVLQKKIENNTQILHEYLVYLYKKGAFISSWHDIDNLKTVLLSWENIDELMNDLYFKSIIQITGQELINKHRKYISSLYIKQIELEKSEQNLKDLRKQEILEKNLLDDKKAAKERLLEVTKWQEQLYQKYIADKLEIERDVKVKEMRERIRINNSRKELLTKYNCEFIDIATNKESLLGLSSECVDINNIIYAESRLAWMEIGYNPLEWPVSPFRWVSAYFRDTEYQHLFGEDHDAIDIIIPQGTEVTAPLDGYVIFIEPPVDTGYAYLALKHTDGLVTLYGHINKSFVEQYDFVKKGDVIALSWWEYGTTGAGVLTTWPHLHFVVYENQEYADPLEYLDISFLRFDDIPERYTYKYLTDFKYRKGYEYEQVQKNTGGRVFRIEWDNEVERQQYLLGTYAVWPFRNWDIWVEESIAWGIDPTFMMCVGLAETSLGKHLKTPFNIGNVGNTDSWATTTFPNARSGIHWMTKTFNNRYLSQYDEIQQLSRYGNKDGSKPIYASSDFNWHNNITKCMSHVKGEYIPDDYEFRLN